MIERGAPRAANDTGIPPGSSGGGRSPPQSAGAKEQELRKALKGLRRILNMIELNETAGRAGCPDADMLDYARRMIAERFRRFQFFDGHLFADPAWDIMLELFVAGLEEREVPVTNLCFTSNVPDTTVLRWIKTLCHEGLVVRHKDRVDKRRVLVELTRPAADAMRRYMDEQIAALEHGAGASHHPGREGAGLSI